MLKLSHVLILLAILIAKSSISQSDTLYANDLKEGVYKYYKSKDGTMFKVGDILKIGYVGKRKCHPTYIFVWEVGTQIDLVRSYANEQSIIKAIKCADVNDTGLQVFFRGTGYYTERDFMMLAEFALKNKEIFKVDYARF